MFSSFLFLSRSRDTRVHAWILFLSLLSHRGFITLTTFISESGTEHSSLHNLLHYRCCMPFDLPFDDLLFHCFSVTVGNVTNNEQRNTRSPDVKQLEPTHAEPYNDHVNKSSLHSLLSDTIEVGYSYLSFPYNFPYHWAQKQHSFVLITTVHYFLASPPIRLYLYHTHLHSIISSKLVFSQHVQTISNYSLSYCRPCSSLLNCFLHVFIFNSIQPYHTIHVHFTLIVSTMFICISVFYFFFFCGQHSDPYICWPS